MPGVLSYGLALDADRVYWTDVSASTVNARPKAGGRAVQLFVIQRTDCDAFEACADLDPAYAAGLTAAAAAGVEVLAYRCTITPRGVALANRAPWRGEPA